MAGGIRAGRELSNLPGRAGGGGVPDEDISFELAGFILVLWAVVGIKRG